MSSKSSQQPAFMEHDSQSLEVYLLGVVDYESARFLQARFAYEIEGRRDRLGALLICEHPPLFTIGRDGSCSDLTQTPEDLRRQLFDLEWVERTGPALFHSPGQLAVYPIVPVERVGESEESNTTAVVAAVGDLLSDQKTPAQFDASTGAFNCRAGRVGVLCPEFRRGVSRHSVYINVCPDMDMQRIIRLSGSETRHSSLMAERSRLVPMHAVRSGLLRRIVEHFDYETHHIYTGHPLLKRAKRRVANVTSGR